MIDTLELANRLSTAAMARNQAEALADELNDQLRNGLAHLPADVAEVKQCLVRVKAELGFRRWAFAIVIGLQIALVLRAF